MASGRLGAADLVAGTNTSVYTVPSHTVATVNVSVANRGLSAADVRLAHCDGASSTLADEDYFEYDVEIEPGGILERTGIVMAETHTIVAYSDRSSVTVQVWGWEEIED